MLRMWAATAGLGFVALLAAGCGARCHRGDARVEDCRPYLESSGEPMSMPPSSLLVIQAGVPLSIQSILHGFVEVSPVKDPDFRGFAVRNGALVLFARDHELRPGMQGHPGSRAKLAYLDEDGVHITASDGQDYVVGCETLGTSAMERVHPVFREPRIVGRDVGMRGSDARLILEISAGERVDLRQVTGDRALVTAWRGDYSFTGWVPASVLEDAGGWAGIVDEGAGGELSAVPDVFSPIEATEPGEPCHDEAVLKPGAHLATGPVDDPDRRPESIPRRELPRVGSQAVVTVDRRLGDNRRVVLTAPTAEVTSVTVWVTAGALDRPTCAMETAP